MHFRNLRSVKSGGTVRGPTIRNVSCEMTRAAREVDVITLGAACGACGHGSQEHTYTKVRMEKSGSVAESRAKKA